MSQLMTQVVNSFTSAVTEFENYPFNSMAKIGDVYYGVCATGCYSLDTASKDNGVNVDASFSMGKWDFFLSYMKRVTDFYIGMRATGPLTLSVQVDERPAYDYTIDPLSVQTIRQRRAEIGKGLRGKYWNFTISNVDGCTFDVDSLDVAAVQLDRRL